jgi:hypothetical protein
MIEVNDDGRPPWPTSIRSPPTLTAGLTRPEPGFSAPC